MKEIYIEYIDAKEKYLSLERERQYFLYELNKLEYVDCKCVDDIKIRVCELTNEMFKVRDIYINKQNILDENIHDGEDYAYCYYSRTQDITFLTYHEYELLKLLKTDVNKLSDEQLSECYTLINNNAAAYAIVKSYIWLSRIDQIRESRKIISKKWWRI